MHTTGAIVVFGKEPGLLATRAILLGRAGYAVATASTEAEVAAVVKGGGDVRLLLLCHTVEGGEAERALRVVEDRCGEVPVLCLTKPARPCAVPGEHETLDATEGPAPLLAKVREMVGAGGGGE